MENAANQTGADGSLEAAAEAFSAALEPEETEETTEETTEDVSEEVSEEPEETEEESEEPEEESETAEEKFERLSEIAEALEMPEDEFLTSIKTTVKVNGQEIEVNLSDLKNGYQMESDYRQKTTDLSEQRKVFEQERDAKTQELQQQVEQSKQIADLLEQQLVGDYESIDWNQLRQESPADYAALKQDYAERAQNIQAIKEHLQQTSESAQKEAQEKQTAQLQQILAEESQKLTQAIPEWVDADKAKQGKAEIGNYLKEYGFGDQELANLVDHRSVVIARKAMLYDRMNKTAKVANKKVSKLPKILKPGAKQGKADIKSAKRSEQMKRLKKSNRVEDAASIFKELIE